MKYSHQLTYAASPAEVHAMLADPAFREEVCVAMHATRHDVTVEESGSGMTVVIDQTQPARGIPSFAKKFVGDEIQIVQREEWRGASSSSLLVEIPGKPAALTGSLHLAADGTGTVQTVTGDVKVRIPMVGGKFEGLVGDLFTAALEAEERVGRAWLARKR